MQIPLSTARLRRLRVYIFLGQSNRELRQIGVQTYSVVPTLIGHDSSREVM